MGGTGRSVYVGKVTNPADVIHICEIWISDTFELRHFVSRQTRKVAAQIIIPFSIPIFQWVWKAEGTPLGLTSVSTMAGVLIGIFMVSPLFML
mmetsp:Transcript_108053/g.186481  ORF Transcript_108053/g.186481 Transcript_108053/m.186481 type:complete len:93 (+) Transcript_108053:1392-1670(+)